MIYPLLPLYLVGVLGTSKIQLGAMEGGAVLIVAWMSAYAGFRSDRRGRLGGRTIWIRWGYGLPVLGKSLLAMAAVWPVVVGGRFLDRFGKGLRGAPRDALLANAVTKEQRGQAFGLHRAFDTAGALVGVLIAAVLLWWLSGTPSLDASLETVDTAMQTPAWVYRTIFAVGAILGLASFALTYLVQEPEAEASSSEQTTIRSVSKRSQRSLTNVAGCDGQSNTGIDDASETNGSRSTSSWKTLPRSFWEILGVLLLFSFANSSDTFLLLRTGELGFSPWLVVVIYATYNFTYSLFAHPAGALSDRIGRERIIMVGWLIYAVVYAGFMLLTKSAAWDIWPLMILYGVYMALTDGTSKALVADNAPTALRGTALGIFYGATGLTTFVSSLITGYVLDRYGSTAGFLVGVVFALLACVGFLIVIRLQRKQIASTL